MYFINYLAYFIVVINTIPSLSDNSSAATKWLCAEKTCTEPISLAKTSKNYPAADEKNKLTFTQGRDVEVLKKPKGDGPHWWVKMDEQVGMVHKDFLKEKTAGKKLEDLVETEDVGGPKATKTIEYKLVEGTRVPVDELDDVTVTAESESLSDAVPGLSASETTSPVQPTPTAATVHLPANGLSQTATVVESKKDAPVLSPENRSNEEPFKTDSPDLKDVDKSPASTENGSSNVNSTSPAGFSASEGAKETEPSQNVDTEAIRTEASAASSSVATSDAVAHGSLTPSSTETPATDSTTLSTTNLSDSTANSTEQVLIDGKPIEESVSSSSTGSNVEPEKNTGTPDLSNSVNLNGTQPEPQAAHDSHALTEPPQNVDTQAIHSEAPASSSVMTSDGVAHDSLTPSTTETPASPDSTTLSTTNSSDSTEPNVINGNTNEKIVSSSSADSKVEPEKSTGTTDSDSVKLNSMLPPENQESQQIADSFHRAINEAHDEQNGKELNKSQPYSPDTGVKLSEPSNSIESQSLNNTVEVGAVNYSVSYTVTTSRDDIQENPSQQGDAQLVNQDKIPVDDSSSSTKNEPTVQTNETEPSKPEDTASQPASYHTQGNRKQFLYQSLNHDPARPTNHDAKAQSQEASPVHSETQPKPDSPHPAQVENDRSETIDSQIKPNVASSDELPESPSDRASTNPPSLDLDKPSQTETAEATTIESTPPSDTWWPPTFLDPLLESLRDYLPMLSPSCCSQDTVEVMDRQKSLEEEKFCEKDECSGDPIPPLIQNSLRHERAYESSSDSIPAWMSYKAVFLMGFTSILVLLFTLGHYYIENLRRDVELASKYNDVSGQLFTEKREKEILEEKLEATQDVMGKVEIYENEIGRLNCKISDLGEENVGLMKKEKEMTKKYAVLMKNYEELRRVLTESKQKGERLSLVADIKKMEANAVEYMNNIASLKEQLVDKQGEIKQLNLELQKSNDVKLKLERDLEKSHLDKQDVVKNLQNSISEMQKSLENEQVTRAKLEDECTRVKKDLERLTIENELAESSLQKAHGLKSSESLSEWLEAKDIRASFLASEKVIRSMSDELISLKTANSNLTEKENYLEKEIKLLNEKYEGAEKEKIDALTRLQVLSDYFKEKETQLQEELGMKEALWVQKQSDDDTLYEQMRSLREENQRTKQVNETLKKEVIEQETSYKKLVSTAEEKAYENWVALRQAERRLKEAQMEASQLRTRLTSLEASGEAQDDKFHNKSGHLDTNGDLPSFGSAASPPFMLYPGDFLPPPPLVHVGGGGPPPPQANAGGVSSLSGGPRPPPVGRISSPPVDFTPPPPLVNYGMFMSSSSASPPPPPLDPVHIVHKPQPREPLNKRAHKDSQSSNQSDSAKDKPVQRNKR